MKWYRLFDSRQALLGALNENGRKMIRIGERRLCLIKKGDQFHVFDNLCPHNKHSLFEGEINYLEEIVCPLHGYRYRLSDGRECDNKSDSLTIHQLEFRPSGVFLGVSD